MIPIGDGGEARKTFLVRAFANVWNRRENLSEDQGEAPMGDMIQTRVSQAIVDVHDTGILPEFVKMYWFMLVVRYIPILTRLGVIWQLTFYTNPFVAWAEFFLRVLWVAVLLFLVDFLSQYRRVIAPRLPFLVATLHLSLEKKGLLKEGDWTPWRSRLVEGASWSQSASLAA